MTLVCFYSSSTGQKRAGAGDAYSGITFIYWAVSSQIIIW